MDASFFGACGNQARTFGGMSRVVFYLVHLITVFLLLEYRGKQAGRD